MREGVGKWEGGKHVIGAPAPRLEKELFGEDEDHKQQHTGINFDKYAGAYWQIDMAYSRRHPRRRYWHRCSCSDHRVQPLDWP